MVGDQEELSPAEKKDHYDTQVGLLGASFEGNDCSLIWDGAIAAASRFDAGALTTLNKDEACNCGNGAIDGAEECDLGRAQDGTNRNRDEYGCSDQCTFVCGDSWTDDAYVVDKDTGLDWVYGGPQGILVEACDDGNRTNGDGCDQDCQYCGNGEIDAGEDCDLGRAQDGTSRNRDEYGCSDSCTFLCGNGTVDAETYVVDETGKDWAYIGGAVATEMCDDGNLDDGDGCDQDCQDELGACCFDPSVGIDPAAMNATDCVNTGGVYNAPDQVEVKVPLGGGAVTDDIAKQFCAETEGDKYCCGFQAPFDPVLLDPAQASGITDCSEYDDSVFAMGPVMNLATATKACKPVFCEGNNCEKMPKFSCKAGYDTDWTPPANSEHKACYNTITGAENIAQQFCKYWIDPNFIEGCTAAPAQ